MWCRYLRWGNNASYTKNFFFQEPITVPIQQRFPLYPMLVCLFGVFFFFFWLHNFFKIIKLHYCKKRKITIIWLLYLHQEGLEFWSSLLGAEQFPFTLPGERNAAHRTNLRTSEAEPHEQTGCSFYFLLYYIWQYTFPQKQRKAESPKCFLLVPRCCTC